MALRARFVPKQLFGDRRFFSHPLRGRERARPRRRRLARQVAVGILRLAQFARMRCDVLRKSLGKESMHNVRFVMRRAFIKTPIEHKQMTRRASMREFHRRHQFAARGRITRRKS